MKIKYNIFPELDCGDANITINNNPTNNTKYAQGEQIDSKKKSSGKRPKIGKYNIKNQ